MTRREQGRAGALIQLPLPPSANRYWRNFNGRMVKSAEAREYQREVGLTLAWMQPLAGNVALTIRLYRARKAGDLDNRIKCVLDALQGYAYANDSQVSEIHAYRYDDKAHPRMEIEVRAA